MKDLEIIKDLSDDKHWLEKSLKLAHIGNWHWDIPTDRVTWSDELYRIYGLNKETFKASFAGYLERIHSEDAARIKTTIENALIKKEQVSFEERIVRPDGDIRYLKSWAYVVLDDKEQPMKMYGACIDITDAKLVELDLAKKDDEFKIILERVSDAFVALDKNWKYTYVNSKAGELFGRKPEYLVGKHIWTEFPEGIDQPFYKAYHRAMETQKYEYIQEYYPPYDLWFENHIYPSPNGLTIYFADITTKKKAELAIESYQTKLEQDVKERTSELERQNGIVKAQKHQIEDIIKELHHRVKNNLQIITSLLRLQSDKVEDESTKEIFSDCQNRIYSMSLIHEKMYQSENLTKINTKDYFPELINDIISSGNISNEIKQNVQVDPVEMPTKMMVPLGLLVSEIVLNSMKHAFKATEQGEILFRFTNEGDGNFKILMGDNGSGIDPNAEIKKNSLGLGLIESFVEQLDGTLTKIQGPGTHYEINFGFVDLK
ncbi:MAG: histidine kinase dimerization/phosphoacceptor domain -containing protein [Bacteroidota bacterium]